MFILKKYRLEWDVSSKPVDNDDLESLLSPSKLLYASWLPNKSSRGSGLVFVEDFSIFYTPDVSPLKRKIYPISSLESTIPEVVIHGVPDWIYEGISSSLLKYLRICPFYYKEGASTQKSFLHIF